MNKIYSLIVSFCNCNFPIKILSIILLFQFSYEEALFCNYNFLNQVFSNTLFVIIISLINIFVLSRVWDRSRSTVGSIDGVLLRFLNTRHQSRSEDCNLCDTATHTLNVTSVPRQGPQCPRTSPGQQEQHGLDQKFEFLSSFERATG